MRVSLRIRRASAAVRLVLLASVLVLAAVLGRPSEARTVHALRDSATGAVSLTDSRGGGAILSAQSLLPGQSVSGSVTLTNSGDSPASVSLTQSDLVDSPGPGGARLSNALLISVDDVTGGRRVYVGPLAVMPAIPLGTFPPGGAREFRFSASLPNALPPGLMGASASVRYDWTATSDPGGGNGNGGGGGNGNGNGGGGGGTTGTPPPQPPAPLTLTVAGKSAQKAKKSISATATCDRPCKLTATATFTGVKKGGSIKPKVPPAGAAAGKPVKITVPFSKKAQAALKKALKAKRSKASVTISVTATGTDGQQVVRAFVVKLKR